MKGCWGLLLAAALAAATLDPSHAAPAASGVPSDDAPTTRAGYRLDDILHPYHYNITIKPDFSTGPETGVITYTGEMVLEAYFQDNVKQIPIHIGSNLRIYSIRLFYPPNMNELRVISTERDVQHELLLINVENTLISNRVNIYIDYTATITQGMEGFFKTVYEVNGRERLFMATQFAPTLARRAFPCLDEPAFKATFRVGIYAPSGYAAVSNMPLDETLSRPGTETSLYMFQQTPLMSTYLVSFILYEQDSYSPSPYGVTTTSAVTFFTYALKDDIDAGRFEYSLSVSYRAVAFLEEYTGLPYRDGNLSKVDHVIVPNLVRPYIDSVGILNYRANTLLVDPEEGTEADKQKAESGVAFHLAQQWFGGRVTPSWWDYAWLSEGFSVFLEYLTVGRIHADWRADERLVLEQQQRAFVEDAVPSSAALVAAVETPDAIREKIDNGVTAAKGASILRMLSYAMGEVNLRNSISELVINKDHSTASNSDLVTRLSANQPSNMTVTMATFISSWTTQPGFPLITFERNYAQQSAVATQARFIGDGRPGSTDYTYIVPILVFSGGVWQTRWLGSGGESFTGFSSSNWVLLNSTGYYRVNYDATNWALLSDALHTEPYLVAPLERAQLVDDALALGRAGTLDYALALELVTYLADETDYVPLTAAFNGLFFLRRMLVAYDSAGVFRDFVLDLLTNVYNQLGFRDTGSHLDKLLRARVLQWACLAGSTDCIAEAQDRFNGYIANGNRVEPNLRRVVYCVGIRYGTDDDWQQLWETLPTVHEASERSDIIAALGCIEDDAKLLTYLDASLELPPPDAADVLRAVYNNPAGVNEALDFLIENFNEVVDVFGGLRATVNAVDGIADYLTTDEEALKIRALATTYPALGSVGSNAYTVATDNAAWVRLYSSTVLDLLPTLSRRMRQQRAARLSEGNREERLQN